MYLAELPESLAQALIGLIGQAYWNAYETIANYQTAADSSEPDENIIDRGIVGPTFKDQVVKSRRGQGVFRANVLLRESACRVTRVDESMHLNAYVLADNKLALNAGWDEDLLAAELGALLATDLDLDLSTTSSRPSPPRSRAIRPTRPSRPRLPPGSAGARSGSSGRTGSSVAMCVTRPCSPP